MAGRKLVHLPVPGFVDLVSILMPLASASALAARVQILGHQNKIEFVLQRMPERWQSVLGVIASIFVWLLFLVIIWRTVVQGASLQAKNQLCPILPIPVFPFYYALALACVLARKTYRRITETECLVKSRGAGLLLLISLML